MLRIAKYLLIALLLFGAYAACSQSPGLPDASAKGTLRTETNLKTGNYLDLLTNFFQLAAKDLGGDDKSFQFKSTLFGIMCRADTSLLIDYNFRQHRMARNLQFEFALHTNKNFRLEGLSGGMMYALINNRDKKNADFTNTPYAHELEKYLEAVEAADEIAGAPLRDRLNNEILPAIKAQKVLLQSEIGPEQRLKVQQALDSLNKIKEAVEKDRRQINDAKREFDRNGKTDNMPELMRRAYEEGELTKMQYDVDSIYKLQMEELAARGLLTLSLNARTDSASRKFNEGSLQLAYLKGLGGRRIEADIRANLSYKDTLTPDSSYRIAFHIVGGANFILLKSKKTDKSLLELKPNLEFRSVVSRQYSDEKNFFSFNMDLRLRITDQIWLPFIVKYDIESQNFLGFLNVSFNMDAFKGAFKSSGG